MSTARGNPKSVHRTSSTPSQLPPLEPSSEDDEFLNPESHEEEDEENTNKHKNMHSQAKLTSYTGNPTSIATSYGSANIKVKSEFLPKRNDDKTGTTLNKPMVQTRGNINSLIRNRTAKFEVDESEFTLNQM
jgi:hypothetical protein